jgi:glycosyltransferase involved in cell wall biosynthesis
VLYHHSIGSETAEWLLAQPLRLILLYHNITPAVFFSAVNPKLARQMEQGRDQLPRLRARVDFAIADSEYNERELQAAGYHRTGVVPFPIDQRLDAPPNAEMLQKLSAPGGPALLFVGRLVPNKRQDDLIKLLYYYRRFEPRARLFLAGSAWPLEYEQWLKSFAADLGLYEAVHFAGHITRPDLLTAYYRAASVYVSMSEHEGFGRPLIESMYLNLPVLAYAEAAVPDTLDEAGLLFRRKHFEALAEVVDLLVNDRTLRARVIARQRARAKTFLLPNVRRRWEQTLAAALDAVALGSPL